MSGVAPSAPAAADFTGQWTGIIRLALLVGGGATVILALAAGRFGMHRGGTLGPVQLQVLVAGAVLAAAGALRAPATILARALERAHVAPAPPLAPLSRSTKRKLTAIVALAFVLRVWMVAAYWPSAQMVMGMALWDAEMARNLLKGRGWVLNWEFVQKVDRAVVEHDRMVDPQDYYPADDSRPGALATFPAYAHTPGYSVWLATSFVFGRAHRFVYSQWMQSALDALACLLVFGIARRLWTSTAGLIGALAYALSPAHMYVAMQTFAAATDSFWVLLVGYGVVRAWRDRAAGRSPVRGLLSVTLGSFAGTMMNSMALVLPAVTGMWAAAIAVVHRPAWRMVLLMAASQAVVLLLLVPWGLRNRAVYGHFTFARQTFWQLAWETLGQAPNPWGLALGKDDAPYFKWLETACPQPCPPEKREAVSRDYLLSNVLVSPAFPRHFLRLITMRLPGLVYVSRLPSDKPYPSDAPLHVILRPLLAVLNSLALFIAPAAALGLAVATMRGRDAAVAAWLGLAPSLFLIAFSLTFFVEHRKTTPAYGYALALAGVGIAATIGPHAEDH